MVKHDYNPNVLHSRLRFLISSMKGAKYTACVLADFVTRPIYGTRFYEVAASCVQLCSRR